MKKLILITCISISFFLMPSAAYSGEKNSQDNSTFTIVGDETQFDTETSLASAKGNVKVWLGEDYLEADDFKANLHSENFSATGNVLFKEAEKILHGNSMEYNWGQRKGSMTDVKTKIDGLTMDGEKLEIANESLNLANSSFTRCTLANPHYRITAKKIIVTPGKMVEAQGATIWIGKMRLFTIPQYTVFLAENGSIQPKYQTEIKYKLSSGPALHIQYFYLLSQNDYLLTDTTLPVRDKISLGAGYLHIGDKINYKLMFTKNGEVDDHRVDIWPELTVDFNKNLLKDFGGNTSGQIKLGSYTDTLKNEPVFRKEWNVNWQSNSIAIGNNVNLASNLSVGQVWYSGMHHLNNIEVKPRITFNLSDKSQIEFGYRYSHKWGESEVSFENPETINEISVDATQRLNERWNIGLGKSYNFNESKSTESRLSVTRNYDCFGVQLNLKEKEDKLSIDISLLN